MLKRKKFMDHMAGGTKEDLDEVIKDMVRHDINSMVMSYARQYISESEEFSENS